jgi:hypothetical protein
MRHFIGCDAHKKYSLFVVVDEAGDRKLAERVNHDRESYRTFLRGLPAGSPIAVETVGNWYWIVDEMQQAVHQPRAKAVTAVARHLAEAAFWVLKRKQPTKNRRPVRFRPRTGKRENFP